MKIGRIIGILLWSSFIGIIFNPEMMIASDSVEVTGVATTGVETVIVEQKIEEEAETVIYGEPRAVSSEPVYEEPAQEEPAYEEPVKNEPVLVMAAEPEYVAPANRIEIVGNTVELEWTNTTTSNAGAATKSWLYKTGKFIFGHNYTHVFGKLDGMYDSGTLNGLRFSVTLDGATSNYTVVSYRVYSYDEAAASMRDIVNAVKDGVQYKMAIMTCYGNSSRLVVFAN